MNAGKSEILKPGVSLQSWGLRPEGLLQGEDRKLAISVGIPSGKKQIKTTYCAKMEMYSIQMS